MHRVSRRHVDSRETRSGRRSERAVRVISGTARGRKLRTLDLPHLRPMLDRVRESLFNIIRADVEGARVLDCFSGCGALGIEALSRGAASCVFVEQDRRLVGALTHNLDRCGMLDRCEVLKAGFFSLPQLPAPEGMLPADLVFLDPPYACVDDPNRRRELFDVLEGLTGTWVRPGALLVLHHRPMPHVLWPSRRLVCCDQRIYGRSQITFFELPEDTGHEGT